MYTKEVIDCSFFRPLVLTKFYKDGKLIAERENDGDIVLRTRTEAWLRLTRSWAYRMWKKHFHGLPCYMLPSLLDKLTETHNMVMWIEPSTTTYSIDNEYGECIHYGNLKREDQEERERWERESLREMDYNDDIVQTYFERFA